MNSVSDWVQVILNGGAVAAGVAVWKLYIENLKTTIGNKESEVSLAEKQVDYWREKATELEKRSPEVVEEVLAKRIAIREKEIEQLAEDRDNSSQELSRLEREIELLNRTLDQTKGFQEVLAMERPDPDDPNYPEYLDYIQEHSDRVVDVEVVYMGAVGVDSGQLLLTDPCYIDAEWKQDDSFVSPARTYRDTETNETIRWPDDFQKYDEDLLGYGQTANDLVARGRLVQLPAPPPPESFPYSYNGACQATLSNGYGELAYSRGHSGAGVAFQSGWGDGYYDVFGEIHDGRIVRVFVNLGADPPPPLTLPAREGESDG